MKNAIFKLGRFLFFPPGAALPEASCAANDIRRPTAFFLNRAQGFLGVADTDARVSCSPESLRRAFDAAREMKAGILYSDYFNVTGGRLGVRTLLDCQEGSIRDDFHFGPLFVLSSAAAKAAIEKYGPLPADPDLAFYDLRLKIGADSPIVRIPECLYRVERTDGGGKKSGRTETHFAYAVADQAARQKKLEKIATAHLQRIGAWLPAPAGRPKPAAAAFPVVASVVIPVLNRKKTIAQAIGSALSQKTDFAFNILVVDNHSTDGTTAVIKKLAASSGRVIHMIPSRCDLGIGGCWNEALHSPSCGRFAVQLDSDDLYASPGALQKIVDTLRRGGYAMVAGSYTLVDKRLRPIPPGLIDHREWSRRNGHNNLLRVGGVGAPRAFDTALAREIGFPNVSFGEDYAVALRFSRDYPIGRIYESLYLCRRWEDNTDAALPVEKQNQNDFYKDRLRSIEIQARRILQAKRRESAKAQDPLSPRVFSVFPDRNASALPQACRRLLSAQKKDWPALAEAYRNLDAVQERTLECGHYSVRLQFNPGRQISSGAAVDPASVRKRPCFLCLSSLPSEQKGLVYRNDYLILCNPAPIFDAHFTVSSLEHRPQTIESAVPTLLALARDASPDFAVFYNGPAAGASAPDHLHFQMTPADKLPFLALLSSMPDFGRSAPMRVSRGFDRSIIVLESADEKALSDRFFRLLAAVGRILQTPSEPMLNVISVFTGRAWRLIIFLRGKHRPDAYFLNGADRVFVSPGTIDMAGCVITPLSRDFKRLDADAVKSIYREVSLNEATLDRIVKQLKGKG